MSSKLSVPSLKAFSRPLRPRKVSKFQCQHTPREIADASSRRGFAAATARLNPSQSAEEPRPRWSYTPERMIAPHSLKKHKPDNQWIVNESPEKLDAFYTRLLGDGGDKLLTDEVKWLAITHKSFDQGRRGYNDRLAFFGTFVTAYDGCVC